MEAKKEKYIDFFTPQRFQKRKLNFSDKITHIVSGILFSQILFFFSLAIPIGNLEDNVRQDVISITKIKPDEVMHSENSINMFMANLVSVKKDEKGHVEYDERVLFALLNSVLLTNIEPDTINILLHVIKTNTISDELKSLLAKRIIRRIEYQRDQSHALIRDELDKRWTLSSTRFVSDSHYYFVSQKEFIAQYGYAWLVAHNIINKKDILFSNEKSSFLSEQTKYNNHEPNLFDQLFAEK